MFTTNFYKNWQTVVPKAIRKELDLSKDTVMDWKVTGKNSAEVIFRKKRTLADIDGIVTTNKPTNAVQLKKQGQRG